MWLVWCFAQWASEQGKFLTQQGNVHVLALDDWIGFFFCLFVFVFVFFFVFFFSPESFFYLKYNVQPIRPEQYPTALCATTCSILNT